MSLHTQAGGALRPGRSIPVIAAVLGAGLARQAAAPSARVPCADTEFSRLVASDAESEDSFGESVSISGDRMVIGAFGADGVELDAGAAYVFARQGTDWIERATLTASGAALGDLFGYAVSIRGGVIAVGAPLDDSGASGAGSVTVFAFDGAAWIEQAELTASDAGTGDQFGVPLALGAGTVVVGAAGADAGGQDAGAAYVYRSDGVKWIEEAKLIASDADARDRFGYAVAIDGETVLVGAFNDDHSGPFSLDGRGSAYVFRFDGGTWIEQARLTASDGVVGDNFGWTVSVRGDTALVGAVADDGPEVDSGSVYVFRFDPSATQWIEQAKLTASDAAAGDNFGFSIDQDDGTALIGARFVNAGGAEAGAAYVFRADGTDWTEQARFTASDAAAFDHFGFSVSVDGGVAVIAAADSDAAGPGSGSAYVFRGLSDCNETGTLDLCDILSGDSQDGDGNGVPDECAATGGDFDGDGDVDLMDFAQFDSCVTGPGGEASDPCDVFDFDGDHDVDLADLRGMLLAFTGASGGETASGR